MKLPTIDFGIAILTFLITFLFIVQRQFNKIVYGYHLRSQKEFSIVSIAHHKRCTLIPISLFPIVSLFPIYSEGQHFVWFGDVNKLIIMVTMFFSPLHAPLKKTFQQEK
jgi:hypothetical protein